jgi:ribosomal protein S18 acetylase RimI-like enzyme
MAATDRAREWRHSYHASVCDSIEPWEHGAVVRASRYPTYYDLNLVRVEEEKSEDLGVLELTAFVDEALAGLDHRRIDVERIELAQAYRAELEALGWKATRLLWMRHERPLPEVAGEIEVREVPYDDVDELRLAWHLEDFDGSEYEQYRLSAREVSLARDVQVLAVCEDDRPIAFAQVERHGRGAEVTQVYVRPDRRGGGRGTAMTRAAVLAASDAEEVWIVADEEDRPKELYRRLGFEPAWSTMELLLLP